MSARCWAAMPRTSATSSRSCVDNILHSARPGTVRLQRTRIHGAPPQGGALFLGRQLQLGLRVGILVRVSLLLGVLLLCCAPAIAADDAEEVYESATEALESMQSDINPE